MMVGYLATVAKVTSTACVIWTVYLLARSRSIRQRLIRSTNCTNDSTQFTQERVMNSDNTNVLFSSRVIPECPPWVTSSDYPSFEMITGLRSYLGSGWRLVSRLLHRSQVTQPNSSNARDPVLETYTLLTVEQLTSCLRLASDLAVQANVPPYVRDVLTRSDRAWISRGKDSPSKLLQSLLTALASYTKNDEFVSLVLSDDRCLQFIRRLAEGLLRFEMHPTSPLRRVVSPTKTPVGVLPGSHNPDMSLINQPPCVDWPTTTPLSVKSAQKSNGRADNHPEYPFHLLLAHLLANLSRSDASRVLLCSPTIQDLLSVWSQSPSLHLILLGQKVTFNLRSHSLDQSDQQSTSSVNVRLSGDIYCPDIYRLDSCSDTDQPQEDPDFDVIFVHGMRGSVFFTWRQHEVEDKSPAYSKCWPRDWLSEEFPRARILAIDASLNPFVWDPICPVDKLERTLDTRAKKILPQLSAAGVGRRPIIWVTHSAGGILVKELLRFSRKPFSTATGRIINNASSSASQSNPPQSPSDFRLPEVFELNPSTPNVTGDPSVTSKAKWFCDTSDESSSPTEQSSLFSTSDKSDQQIPIPISQHECASECFIPRDSELERFKDSPEGDSDLTNSTKGIIFLSAPHRGNRSLLALYRRPLRWTLTPEAIQLERNSQFLLDLHAWFNLWAARAQVKVLTMVETRETPVNRFWSVLLVPEDTLDREMGEVIRIDSDHTYISKPRSRADLMYQRLVNFIRSLR